MGLQLPKSIVSDEQGLELAQSVGGQFFRVNANGKNVRKALEAVVASIYKVEENIVFDREPTRCEKFHKTLGRCTVM